MTVIQNRINHRIPVTDFMSTLQSVQINPTEMCNRTCSFCPRVDPAIYKNRKEFISTELCKIIGQQLSEFQFKGRVGFVGFGEPLLHDNLPECVSSIRTECPTVSWLEVNTNGDFLTRDIATKLFDNGLTHLTISMYDSDETERFNEMLKCIPLTVTLRHSYNTSNIQLVDRIGIVKQVSKNINRQCYIPFYKLFIDYNGDYLLCDQDWGRKSVKSNIHTTTIRDFWTNQLVEERVNLIQANRQKNNPCDKCDVNGTLIGKESFDYIRQTMSI